MVSSRPGKSEPDIVVFIEPAVNANAAQGAASSSSSVKIAPHRETAERYWPERSWSR